MGFKEWFFGKSVPTGSVGPEGPVDPGYHDVVPPPMPKVKKPRKSRADSYREALAPVSEKDIATQKGEPWVSVLGMEVDMDDISDGSFELDWNEIFVARLIKAGYKGKDDITIVDQWFQDVCRNIALETFEQDMADPEKRHRFNK